MPISEEPPTTAELVRDLKRLREKGLTGLGGLDVSALRQAARRAGGDVVVDERPAVEALLRRAISRLGGGAYGEAASVLFGLDEGTRTITAGVRRTMAAEKLGISATTLRRTRELPLLRDVAQQILTLCAEQHVRTAHERREVREPVESAMAVKWLERFEAYYRIWTPIFGLANDLTAYRMTRLEEPRPYDRRFGTQGPDDEGYSQEEQAEGYARDALYHYACYEWEVRRFISQFGGLWMLSDAQAEQDVADAIHRIQWHVNPFSERDRSFLRTVLDETPHQELHPFMTRLASTEIGQITHREWQDWVTACQCVWPPGADTGSDYFPTRRTSPRITKACQVHQVIEACVDYCRLIDEDWLKIADWYHLDKRLQQPRSDEERYVEWRATPEGVEYEAPNLRVCSDCPVSSDPRPPVSM